MTNPQDSQNSIPERRKKAAAGVTFDEMIAIIVAFSTIGAILFWTLGGKKGGIAGNFGFGGQSNSLFTNNTGIGIGGIDANSDVNFGEPELDRGSLRKAERKLEEELSIASASTAQRFSPSPRRNDESYAIAGSAAVLPGLLDRPGVNRNTVPRRVEIKQPAIVAPEVETAEQPAASTPETAEVEKPVATTPETVEKPDTGTPKIEAEAPETAEMPDDVVPSYWAYPFVKQMSGEGLVPDFSDDQNFEPNKLITRAGMATLISQAFDYKDKNERIKQFRDVSDDNAIAADVNEAVRMGFMQGYSEDTFRPLENIPRYQVLVTLATGLGLKPSGDPDRVLQKLDGGTDIPDWAKEQVAAAAESGLIVNRPEFASNSLNPNESATRGEVAAMIHQALVKTGKLKSIESEYILKP